VGRVGIGIRCLRRGFVGSKGIAVSLMRSSLLDCGLIVFHM